MRLLGSGELDLVREDRELIQEVNPGQERRFGVVLCKL